jgi:hypothetical protein
MCTGYPVPILTEDPVLSTGYPDTHGISLTNPTGYPASVYGGVSREIDDHGKSRRLVHGISRKKTEKQKGSERALSPV